MRTSITLLSLGCSMGLLAGCVTTSKHQAALSACTSQRAKAIADREAKIKALAAKLLELDAQAVKGLKSAAAKLEASQSELEELRKQRAATERRLAEFKKLTEKFQKMIDAGKIKVYVRRGRMMVALPSSVLFASGKAELSDRGKKALAQVAETLKEFPKRRFQVAGHTDNVRIKKSEHFKDNWELSSVRALNVTRFLIEQGLNPRNLAMAGYSKYDPARSNRRRSGRRLNRRIEVILVPDLSELPKLTKLK
jgi:chemotaxis protein MotB